MITERAVKVGMEGEGRRIRALFCARTFFLRSGFSVSEAARQLGVTRQTLHRIMAEKVSITPEMAARLSQLCGNGPGIWLRMQQACDLWRAERELRAELARIPVHRTSSAA